MYRNKQTKTIYQRHITNVPKVVRTGRFTRSAPASLLSPLLAPSPVPDTAYSMPHPLLYLCMHLSTITVIFYSSL